MPRRPKVLVVIPARGGSQRIPHKNIRKFLGRPLIAYAIQQALSWPPTSRLIVDTDSPVIAAVARRYGAEVPWLRPAALATNRSSVNDALLYLLQRLRQEQNYRPDYVLLLQTTSPLREITDLQQCWRLMQRTKADTVLTIAPTHPRLYYLDQKQNIILGNGSERQSTNIQEWRPAYILNGCFVYIFNVRKFLQQKIIIMKNTKAVICDRWRSVDLDTPEDWALAELLYKNRRRLARRIAAMKL
ncbi:MAG: acylneuraminate cytidylyltransferase family protein [Candidatus Magasanikbacteria bacterium]|nr:acylneuraminate cytidylyltransferase family protein [Candidatus Magasanikbacteria bacterium]